MDGRTTKTPIRIRVFYRIPPQNHESKRIPSNTTQSMPHSTATHCRRAILPIPQILPSSYAHAGHVLSLPPHPLRCALSGIHRCHTPPIALHSSTWYRQPIGMRGSMRYDTTTHCLSFRVQSKCHSRPAASQSNGF